MSFFGSWEGMKSREALGGMDVCMIGNFHLRGCESLSQDETE